MHAPFGSADTSANFFYGKVYEGAGISKICQGPLLQPMGSPLPFPLPWPKAWSVFPQILSEFEYVGTSTPLIFFGTFFFCPKRPAPTSSGRPSASPFMGVSRPMLWPACGSGSHRDGRAISGKQRYKGFFACPRKYSRICRNYSFAPKEELILSSLENLRSKGLPISALKLVQIFVYFPR